MKDFEMNAAALYDGGWRAEDSEQFKEEYGLTDEETTELAIALYEIENDL